MSFNTPDIKKLAFHKVLRVSTVEYEQDKGAFKAAYQQEMREGLAHHIQHARVDLNVTKDFIEAKLDLYVATPEEFWALVNFQAEQIANRYGCTLIEHPARKPKHWFVKFNNGSTSYVRTQAEADSIQRCLAEDESITPLYE